MEYTRLRKKIYVVAFELDNYVMAAQDMEKF
jgi:hypothetical protein